MKKNHRIRADLFLISKVWCFLIVLLRILLISIWKKFPFFIQLFYFVLPAGGLRYSPACSSWIVARGFYPQSFWCEKYDKALNPIEGFIDVFVIITATCLNNGIFGCLTNFWGYMNHALYGLRSSIAPPSGKEMPKLLYVTVISFVVSTFQFPLQS